MTRRHYRKRAEEFVDCSAGLLAADVSERRYLRPLFQVGAHDADQIVGSFFRRFAVSRHMVANVVFHELGHEAVDRSSGSREPLKDVCTLFVIVESAQNGFQLPDDFLCPVDKVQLFSRGM